MSEGWPLPPCGAPPNWATSEPTCACARLSWAYLLWTAHALAASACGRGLLASPRPGGRNCMIRNSLRSQPGHGCPHPVSVPFEGAFRRSRPWTKLVTLAPGAPSV